MPPVTSTPGEHAAAPPSHLVGPPSAAVRSPARLEAVEASHLLDTAPEEAFDRLTALAATILELPAAFITVLDERRSFWKSCFGGPGGERERPVGQSFCQYVVEARDEVVVDDAATDQLTRDNPFVVGAGRAWAGAPLLAPDGEVLGSLVVVDTVPRTWTERDREVLRVLAAAATGEVALRAAAEDARELAETLQASLLPAFLPVVPGLDVAAFHHAGGTGAEVVGDFYDLFQSGEHRWKAVVGDVCGKGVEAAKVTALARYTVRAAAMTTHAPSDILHTLNRALLDQQGDTGRFLTAAVATLRLDGDAVDVELCSGGHTPVIVRRADGEVTQLGLPGTLLGAFDEVTLEDVRTTLGPGDAMVLCTDGITEARRGAERFGDERLRALLVAPAASAQELASRIDAAVQAFSSGSVADDMAVLVLRVPDGGVPRESADRSSAAERP